MSLVKKYLLLSIGKKVPYSASFIISLLDTFGMFYESKNLKIHIVVEGKYISLVHGNNNIMYESSLELNFVCKWRDNWANIWIYNKTKKSKIDFKLYNKSYLKDIAIVEINQTRKQGVDNNLICFLLKKKREN